MNCIIAHYQGECVAHFCLQQNVLDPNELYLNPIVLFQALQQLAYNNTISHSIFYLLEDNMDRIIIPIEENKGSSGFKCVVFSAL